MLLGGDRGARRTVREMKGVNLPGRAVPKGSGVANPNACA